MAKIISRDGYDDVISDFLIEAGIDAYKNPIKGFGYLSIDNKTYGFVALADGKVVNIPSTWLIIIL